MFSISLTLSAVKSKFKNSRVLFFCCALLAAPHSVIQVAIAQPVTNLPAIQSTANLPKIQREMLTMPDGTKIAVSFYLPADFNKQKKYPVLFEMHPYRKDDLFLNRDYSLYEYFTKNDYVIAKADVRGTGSSEGAIPTREYSEIELQDATEIIDQLSKMEWSNGNIGMWGISWSGFNAIQVAMRRPTALKAIFAVNASDDLFKDDVHFIDGAFHIDEYELSIENDLSLPQWPEYKFDNNYFLNRFERRPWFLTYKEQQIDSDFWRKNSLRWDYQSIQIPIFLIGGLLDGYKDSIPRMLENMHTPIKAIIGPWNHAWPDNGEPAPVFEWRPMLIKWWDHWLKNEPNDVLIGPNLMLFVRSGDAPRIDHKKVSGHWRNENWPIERTINTTFYLSEDHDLYLETPLNKTLNKHSLFYKPSSGVQLGYWWGELTGDMSPADAGNLIYDSPPVEKNLEIIGMPQARIHVASDSPVANWVVRLEDVAPNGQVALVTGSVFNGSQRYSRLYPQNLVPDEFYNLDIEMHFTTWTFKPGHRIRFVVSNALFPMIWPSPKLMTTQLDLAKSLLTLPIIPFKKTDKLILEKPFGRLNHPHYQELKSRGWPSTHEITSDIQTGITQVKWAGEDHFKIEEREHFYYEKTLYQTNDNDPAHSLFSGEAGHQITWPKILPIGNGNRGRKIDVKIKIDVVSDAEYFYINFTRFAFENKKLIRQKKWEEKIKRQHH